MRTKKNQQTISTFSIVFSYQNLLLHIRPRVHNLQLPDYPNRLADTNFIVRMLFINVY